MLYYLIILAPSVNLKSIFFQRLKVFGQLAKDVAEPMLAIHKALVNFFKLNVWCSTEMCEVLLNLPHCKISNMMQ